MKRLLPILLFLVLSSPALAAVETTTVQGTVYLPDGQTVATAGTIRAQISDACSTTDGSGQVRISGRIEADIGSDGSVDIDLVPNDACTPAGTYYTVRISVTSPSPRTSWTEKWSVTTSPDPIYIGSVTRLEYAPGITVGDYMEYESTVTPGAACTAADKPTFDEAANALCECSSSVWACVDLIDGPASSTDNCIVRFDGTSADALQQGTNCPTYDDSGNMSLNGTYIKGPADSSEGTCSASERYRFKFVTGGAGVADQLMVCMKNASDTYNWVLVAEGGA